VTKTLRVWVLSLIVCAFQTGTSFAASDWLDRLSGPGPFRSYVGLTYRFLCVTNGRTLRTTPGLPPLTASDVTDSEGYFTWLHPFEPSASVISVVDTDKLRESALTTSRSLLQRSNATPDEWKPVANALCRSDERVKGYASISVRHFKSIENNLFARDPKNELYQVRLFDADVTYTARVNRAMSIGAGAGAFWFSGDSFDTFHRATVTPVIVEAAPFAAAGDRLKYRFLRLYGAYTMIVGQLDAADFCSRGKCTARPASFHVANEFVWRYGVDVDVSAVLQWFIQ
jgi:hypothetical protein